MADMSDLMLDAHNEAPLQTFELFPQMKALAIIVDSSRKPSKSDPQNGERIEFTYEILEPAQFKGRKIFSGHNTKHKKPEVVKIARSELAAICKAVGVKALRDTVQLHNLPLVLDIRVQKRKDAGHEGELQNQIKNWEPKGTPLTAPQPLPAAAQTGAPTTATGASPWTKPAGASPF